MTALDVTPPSLVRAMTTGALAYVIAWATAFAGTFLSIIGLSLDEDVSWWWLLTGPGQLVAMAFRSPAVGSFDSGDPDFAISGEYSVTAIPMTVLALAVWAIVVLSRRAERRESARSVKGMVSLAVTSAVTFIVIAFVLALVLAPELEEETAYRASQFQLVLFGLPVLAVAALVGRRPLPQWSAFRSIPFAALDAGRAVLAHFVVFTALAIPAAAIYVAVEGDPEAILVMPVALLDVAVYALTLGHLGALSTGGFGFAFGQSTAESDSLWLFGDDAPKIFLLLIVFAALATLAAAVTLRLRNGSAARPASHWVWTPLVFGIAGGLLTFLSTISFGVGGGGGFGGSASFGPASWFLLVLAAWGALAEVVSRTFAGALVGLVPAAWQQRLAGQRPEAVPAAATTAGADVAHAAPSQTPTSLDPRSKKILIGIGALVVVGVVAAIGVSIANSMFYGPEKQAEAYFDALGSGDAGKALDLVRLDYSSEERALLTEDVLEAGDTTISDVSFGDVETSGDVASVKARYTIDGADQTQELMLEKTGSRFGVFDTWKIVDPGLGTIYVSAPGASSLEVNGASIDVEGLDDGATLPAFPGKYEIAPGTDSSLVTYGSESVTIGTDEESLDFEAEPTDALVDEVAKQANAFLDACIQRNEAEPDGCPNQTYWSDLEDVSWKLTSPPTYAVESDYDGGWNFSTSIPGKAMVSATEPGLFDGDADSKYTDEVQIDLSGTVTISGDTATVKVDDSYF
ncbi:hypothetical protein [Aeromicrobium sp. NPDC092404]|uniref:hypothetical protein n=1 Tax=Aeromicrobium sp. NPDC092404 TaxID=3154976 RepID=UPI003441E500